MNMLMRITLASLKTRRFPAAMVICTVAFSVMLVVGVDRLRDQVRQSFTSTVSGIDLIVASRGGPLNILLYSVFRISDPTANMSGRAVEYLQQHDQVDWVIPISLGDSHRGFPVVATNDSYLAHFRYGRSEALELATGRWFDGAQDVVLGAEVARRLQYTLGDSVVLAHGGGKAAIVTHDQHPFTVTGVLAATGTPVDHSLHISLAGMDLIHQSPTFGMRLPGQGRGPDAMPASLTAALVGLKSRTAVLGMQREIQRYSREPLSAIMPGVELQRLWRLTSAAEMALIAVSWAVLLISVLVLVAITWATLDSRRREFAVLRALGARRPHVHILVAGEGVLLAALGCIIGLVALFMLQWLFQMPALTEFGVHLPDHFINLREVAYVAVLLLTCVLSGLLPAERAFRNSLADGLAPRY